VSKPVKAVRRTAVALPPEAFTTRLAPWERVPAVDAAAEETTTDDQ
jgi:hypothetical protein